MKKIPMQRFEVGDWVVFERNCSGGYLFTDGKPSRVEVIHPDGSGIGLSWGGGPMEHFRPATPEEVEAVPIEIGNWINTVACTSTESVPVLADAGDVSSYRFERERGGWRGTDWCHCSPAQYRKVVGHEEPEAEPEQFEAGDWVCRVESGEGEPEMWMSEYDDGAHRIVMTSNEGRSKLGFSTAKGRTATWYSCNFRRAEQEEIDAVPIEEGGLMHGTGCLDATRLDLLRGGRHGGLHKCPANSGGRGCSREPKCRHATGDEWRAAQAPPPEKADPEGLLDSRDDLVPPTEEEMRLTGEVEKLTQERDAERERYSKVYLQVCRVRDERDISRRDAVRNDDLMKQAQDELAKTLTRHSAEIEALKNPPLSPILYGRFSGKRYIDVGIPVDEHGLIRVCCEEEEDVGANIAPTYPCLLTTIPPSRAWLYWLACAAAIGACVAPAVAILVTQ